MENTNNSVDSSLISDSEINNAIASLHFTTKKLSPNSLRLIKQNKLYLINECIMSQIDYLISNSYLIKVKNAKEYINDEFMISLSIVVIQKIFNEHLPQFIFDKYFLFLHMMYKNNIISINTLLTIIKIYLRVNLNKIIEHNEQFIYSDDEFFLIKTLVVCLCGIREQINAEFIDEIINSIKEKIFGHFDILLRMSKESFFMLLLKVHIKDKNEKTHENIMNFLIEIYKLNLSAEIITNYIIKMSMNNVHFLKNSIEFLNKLMSYEDKIKKSDTYLSKGFIVTKNNPLIFSKLQINFKKKITSVTFIFSFMLLYRTIEEQKVNIFNIKRLKDGKNEYSFFIDNKDMLYLSGKEEKKKIETKIKIEFNKEYLFVVTHTQKTKELLIYINEKKYTFSLNYPKTESSSVAIELGNYNFNGFFGDVIQIDKALTEDAINKIYSFKENYSYCINQRVSLYFMQNYDIHLAQFDSTYRSAIGFFINDPIKDYKIISTEWINPFTTNRNEIMYLNDEDIVLKHQLSNKQIEIFIKEYSFFRFLQNNGTNYLLFTVHQINNPFLNLSNNQLNKIFELLLEFIYNLLGWMGTDYLMQKNQNEKHFLTLFLTTMFNLIYDKKKTQNFKLNEKVIYYLTMINNLCIMEGNENTDSTDNTEISKMIIFNFFDVSLIDISKLKDSLLDLFTSIGTSIKTNPSAFQNRALLHKVLAFDFVIEIDNFKENNYDILLNLCLLYSPNEDFVDVKCFEVINNFFWYLAQNRKTFSEKKKLFYTKFVYQYLLLDKYINEIQVIKKFYIEFAKTELEKISLSHCENCEEQYCIYYLIIKECIRIKLFSPDEETDYSRKIDKLYVDHEAMKKPTFSFIKTILCSLLTCCDEESKLKFIKDPSPNSVRMISQCSFFPLKYTEKSEYVVKTFLENIYSFVKYIKKLFEINDEEFKQTTGEKAMLLLVDFIFTCISSNKTRNTLFLDLFISHELLTSFFLFYLKRNPIQTQNFVSVIIKQTISETTNGFYLLLLQEERRDRDFVKIIIHSLLVREKDVRFTNKYYKHLLNILIYLYNEITVYNDFSALVDLSNDIMIFISDLNQLRYTELKVQFDTKKDNKIVRTVIEMAFDIYEFFFKKSDLNMKFLYMIEGLILKQVPKKDELIFYQMDKDKTQIQELSELYKIGQPTTYSFCVYFLVKIMILRSYIYYEKKVDNTGDDKIRKEEIEKLSKTAFTNSYNFMITKNRITSYQRLNKTFNNYELYNDVLNYFETNPTNNNYKHFVEYFNKHEKTLSQDAFLRNKNSKSITKINVNKITRTKSDNDYSLSPQHGQLSSSQFAFEKDINPLSASVFVGHVEKAKPKVIKNNQRSRSLDNKKHKELNKLNPRRKQTIEKVNSLKDKTENNNINEKTKYLSFIEPPTIIQQSTKVNVSTTHSPITEISNANQESISILFNPKNYFIWKHFAFILKDSLFHNKNFELAQQVYNRKFSPYLQFNIDREKRYELSYPTKLLNFICDEYYKPFLKPELNFFNHKYYKISHPYFDCIDRSKELSSIKFTKVIPKLEKPNINFYCELVSNQGYIFGNLFINNYMILFFDISDKDFRFKDEIPIETKMEFIFSSDGNDRITTKNKNVLINIEEIQEVVPRRFCFLWLGYEIFLKNKKSYLFNFFRPERSNEFFEYLSNISNKRKLNLLLIKDSKAYFKKKKYKNMFKNGEIDNFHYLLLVNKYASRTYNDISQYPVMPWVINNLTNFHLRDFSRTICQQKNCRKDDNIDSSNDDKYISNMKTLKCHFMLHYSNSGYIMHYLSRVNPITYDAIKFQSNQFDQASRMFFSMIELLKVFEVVEDNRELIPEFFSSYYFMLNLNKNDFGYFKEKNIQIGNVLCEKGKGSCITFVASQREQLDNSAQLNKWIDNVFGVNQLNDKIINIFPKFTYAQNNNFEEKIKKLEAKGKTKEEIYSKIRTKIGLLNLGVTPHQLFVNPHPEMEKRNETPSEKEFRQLKKEINYTAIALACKNNKYDTYNIICKEKSIYFLFKSRLHIYDISMKEKSFEVKLNLQIEEQVQMLPAENAFCKISYKKKNLNFFIFSRYTDNTIKLYNDKKDYIKSLKWNCFISSIVTKSNSEFESNIIIGDYNGYLTELNLKYKESQTVSALEVNRVQAHDCMIKEILYSERLGVVISVDAKNVITINNAYSFCVITIIEPQNSYGDIKKILLSKNDFLYIQYESVLELYTLNGILVDEQIRKSSIAGVELYEEVNHLFIGVDRKIEKYLTYNLTKKKMLQQQDLSKKGEDLVKFVFSNELKMALIVYKDNTLEIKYY